MNASGKNKCCRPNCDWPHEASNDNEDYFFVEGVVGRSVVNKKKPGTKKLVPSWLVKWQGLVDITSIGLAYFTKLDRSRYDIKECDWLEEENIPDAHQFIAHFYERAKEEGISVVDDNSLYLLKEAKSRLPYAIKEKWKWTVER